MDGSSTAVSTSLDSSSQALWKVLHLTSDPEQIVLLIEAQNALQRRAQATKQAETLSSPSQPSQTSENPSWQTVWGEVPRWREALLQAQKETFPDIVHAYTFAAGMAAVRNFGCVVYELNDVIENVLEASQSAENSPWLRRSFRVAEQFILSRAGGVVIHSEEMRDQLRARGVEEESLFVVNVPSDQKPASLAHQYDKIYRHAHKRRQRQSPQSNVFRPPQYSL